MTIVTSSLTTSSENVDLLISNDGTSPLFISTIESNVPWATIFEDTPGNQPDLTVPIEGGTARTLGVQFQGGSTPGCDGDECFFIGNITVLSNAPATPQLSIGMEYTVSKPNLAVIAIPQQLSTTLYPQESHTYNLLVYNVGVQPIDWEVSGCDCVCGRRDATSQEALDCPSQMDVENWLAQPGRHRSCAVATTPWIEFGSCGGTLGAQESGGLVADFTAVEAVWTVGVYSATIDVAVPAKDARWPVTATLQIITDARFFSANTSYYDFGATGDGVLIPGGSFTVSVQPRDRWGNEISEPLVGTESLSFRVVEPYDESVVLGSFGMDYDYMSQLQIGEGTIERNGTFLLLVTTSTGAEIKPRLADETNNPHWRDVNMSGLVVESRPCEPPRTFPNRNGNACLYAWCDPGKEVQNTVDAGVCASCVPGTFSAYGVRCEPCPANTYCAVTGCDVCLECDVGKQPRRADDEECVDFDECAKTSGMPNGNCDPIVECENTEGSRICGPCPPGYTGNGDKGLDGTGEGCTMPEIPSELGDSASKMQLSTKVEFVASPDVLVEGSPEQQQYIDTLVRQIADSMGVNVSEINVRGLKQAGARRRTQTVSDPVVVSLDFVVSSANPAAALLDLSEQLSNSSSPLMTSEIAPRSGQTAEADYSCPDFMVMLEGAAVCTACGQGKEPVTPDCDSATAAADCPPGRCEECSAGRASKEGRECIACSPGSQPSENNVLCEVCASTEYSETGKECRTCAPVRAPIASTLPCLSRVRVFGSHVRACV
jgi:hypothetical protein